MLNKANDLVKNIEKKRQEHIGLITNVFMEDKKVRICPPCKKGYRTLYVHNLDKEISEIMNEESYELIAQHQILVKDSLKNIVNDINDGWIRV